MKGIMKRCVAFTVTVLLAMALLVGAFPSMDVYANEPVGRRIGGMQLYGDASIYGNGIIQLTPLEFMSVGSAWNADKFSTSSGLVVTFSYWAGGGNEKERLGRGDGFIVNFAREMGIGGNGGSLGFQEGGGYGVEFDAYPYEMETEPPGKHIAIVKDSVSNHLAWSIDKRVDDSLWHTVKIVYNKPSMSVYVDNSLAVSSSNVCLDDEVYIGVSAATGNARNEHLIRNLTIFGEEAGSGEDNPDDFIVGRTNLKIVGSCDEDERSVFVTAVVSNKSDVDAHGVTLTLKNEETVLEQREFELEKGKTARYEFIIPKYRIRYADEGATCLVLNVTVSDGGDYSEDDNTAYLYLYERPDNLDVRVTGLTMSAEQISLPAGSSMRLSAFAEPDNAWNPEVIWSSSDTGIADVDAMGMVTSVAEGTATVSATATNGTEDPKDDVVATCEVIVTEAIVEPCFEPPTQKTGLVYNGEPQELVNPGIAQGGVMLYAVSDTDQFAPPDYFYSEYPPMGVDAGVYYIWYKVLGDSNHLDTEPGCILAEIEENNRIGWIASRSILLQNDITMKFYAEFLKMPDAPPILEVNRERHKTFIEGTWEDGRYAFYYEGISPHFIGDNLTATMSYMVNGKEYQDRMDSCGVVPYCMELLAMPDEELETFLPGSATVFEMRTLLVDILCYGARAQEYMGYKLEHLATEELTAEQYEFASVYASPTLDEGVILDKDLIAYREDKSYYWCGASAMLRNAAALRLYFKAPSGIEGLKVKVNDSEYEIQEAEAGKFFVEVSRMSAGDFEKIYTLCFEKDGKRCGQLLYYSLTTYISKVENHEECGALARSLYNYGRSARAYAYY